MKAGASPWSFPQGWMGHTVLAAESPALPGSPHPLYVKAFLWFIPHISGKCWAYLARATEGVQTGNPINSGFILGRNEAWDMVSAVKQLTQSGSGCCPPQATSSPFPIHTGNIKSQMQERRQWWPLLEIKQWERAHATSQIINPALILLLVCSLMKKPQLWQPLFLDSFTGSKPPHLVQRMYFSNI